jgi:hypothetical protein
MAQTTTMTYSTGRSVARTQEIISRITALGHRVLRYGLALVIGWIGMMKFTGYASARHRAACRAQSVVGLDVSHMDPTAIRDRVRSS